MYIIIYLNSNSNLNIILCDTNGCKTNSLFYFKSCTDFNHFNSVINTEIYPECVDRLMFFLSIEYALFMFLLSHSYYADIR